MFLKDLLYLDLIYKVILPAGFITFGRFSIAFFFFFGHAVKLVGYFPNQELNLGPQQ